MRGLAALVLHSLRRRRGFLLAVCAVLFALQIVMTLVASELHKSGAFAQLEGLVPDFLEQWTNRVGLSFRGVVLFGHSHPIVILFLIAMAIGIGTEIALEIEMKFVDLLMARPLRRITPVLRSVAVLLISTGAALATMLLGTWIGLTVLAPRSARVPEPQLVVSLSANLGLVVLAWGGITLAIASCSRRRATAAASTGLLAFVMFVLDYIGRFWEKAEGVATISPFHYYDPFGLIGGNPLPVAHVVVLGAIFVAGSILACVMYSRRDL